MSATFQCPKCRGVMRTYNRSGVHIEQCDSCRGIFLDYGELESLERVEAQAVAAPPAMPPAMPPAAPMMPAAPMHPAPMHAAPMHGGPAWGQPYYGHGRRHHSLGKLLFSS